MKKIFALIIFAAVLFPLSARARIYIPIDQPSTEKFPIAITDLQGGDTGEDISEIIRNDLNLSGYFRIIPPSSFKDVAKKEGISQDDIGFGYWTAIEAQALVKGEVKREKGKLSITVRLFDPFLREMLVGKQYTAEKKHLREVAHRFSDEIMHALTGIPGVFNTKIAYTAITGKGQKGIYVMDMDGYNPFAITKNKSLNLSPSWSPDGSQIVYTSYIKGDPDLYITKLGSRNMHKITSRMGSNITPSWSPKGSPIAFASSLTGISNIFTKNPSGGKAHPLTNTECIDIAPSYSPDGGSIVFASERAGGLHLYKMNGNGAGAHRLTFVGYQNDMPNWSPMGDKIVFAGRDMGTFDIFIMNADGTNIQRLTVGAGSNEHPSFSPDGRLITFSSTRAGGPAVFLMRADGSNQMRISKGNGLLPSWGPQKEKKEETK
ncbi:MAG: Tol-Pal system beta propeller repeat protein TolB [Pseudomonadota bacterium]